MARPSARPKLIDAALTVVAERGVTALTLDAVAEQAGVTKRGLIYHFPSKHALLVGIHTELAARMERRLLDATGREPETASLVERTRGYVRAAVDAPTTVELRLIMEAANEPDWLAPWERVYRRWFPEEEQSVDALDAVALRCLVARMAADGSWGYESMLSTPMTPQARERLTESILDTLGDA
ncbi:TetR family transcriptional regulator [Propionibacteriaceae bacterium ES.041]|uniref:TetR/AcrR family transcriptional regulator n=1 Tax=Enemella evansiae TaxID=2016499 RepID=UPI000B967417|nr:TetR/AcrR family transcriptional regulator [Enemella evansiae]OYN96181.1 TetR family transcriptional regulator [Enemella evansiae]PFG65403.1 TetR family transcriptional regulator [Propionibacteriaceae bacterium ES.041]